MGHFIFKAWNVPVKRPLVLVQLAGREGKALGGAEGKLARGVVVIQ
jgi:hypothetical protein